MSGGKPPAEKASDEVPESISLVDKDLQAACNDPPFAGIQPKQLSKSGWFTTPNHPYLLVAHYPKVFRTPNPKFPRCTMRSTWVYREGAWSKIEDNVDVRDLKVKAGRFEERTIMSVTMFTRPDDDPELVPDSDLDLDHGPEGENMPRDERLKLEAKSQKHLFCHRPKNPFCPTCQKAKMMAPYARKTGGSSTVRSEAYGDHVTMDHIIARDLRDYGFDDQRVALVVKDVFSKFRYVYPSDTKEGEQVLENLLHFVGVDDDIKVMYSDNAPELIDGVKQLDRRIRHVTSREYANQNKSVAEREIRTVLEGTRANLVQSGLPEKFWPLAAQHHAMALNLTKRVDADAIPWDLRFGEPFGGMNVPFGAKVLYWNDPKRKATAPSKFGPSSAEGVFLGYHIQPGFIWKGDYIVTPVEGLRDALEIGKLPMLRVNRMEIPVADHSFPALELSHDKGHPGKPPQLDDQNCHAVQDRVERALQKGKAMDDKPVVEVQGGGTPDGSGVEIPYIHDHTKMPDGSPVPKGYTHDGWRLVRKRKGSRRPPDTPLDMWNMYTPKEKEDDIKRYADLVKRVEEAKRRRAAAEAPAMPVVAASAAGNRQPEGQAGSVAERVRMKELLEDKLEQAVFDVFGMVARVVSQSEIDRTPEAQKAMDAEWEKLRKKTCWLEEKVREYDVANEARKNNAKVHFGRIFEICSQKGSELPDGDPNKKWKGRSVFQGNRVHDEHHDHALFAELGSSPASMESGKILDAYGSQPGFSKQQADARQAYTQALFEGVTTWVRLPKNRWPSSWKGYRDPVCPLRLALYGHPDAGGIWEKHCETQLKSVGWIPILPEIWQSVFYHPELELMLVVYVDDFKMAGPTKNMAQGWKDINSVIDMDPPEALGRYFGCNHVEKQQASCPKSEHPFARVFEGKPAAIARGDPSPVRREDFWEVDLEAGAVVRHHVYPRKKLYVPTENDVLAFPMMGTSRVTEFDSKEELHVDDFNQGGEAKFDWWTGRTYFPLDRETPVEDFTYALASYKKKNPRSKTEAKNKVKESRFKPPESIIDKPTPCMINKVNIVTYDMEDFLGTCVEKYCELAKVDRKTLRHAATPFHEARIAKPVDPDKEPTGKLAGIASRILMKVLFAARMARWDLLRATQALASRVTKWSPDCDIALHRQICYINSSMNVKLKGFVGDKISECKLWMFCDADWAGDADSKSTSGCMIALVGPNTYFPLNAFSKKQTSITTSSTESEVVAANHGVRAQGMPSLSLWSFLWKQVEIGPDKKVKPYDRPDKDSSIVAKIDPELDEIRYGSSYPPKDKSVANIDHLRVHLSDKFKVQVLEDNQATITITATGSSASMRHTDRTQRISFRWLKQQFEVGHFNMINVDTTEQAADIFTKPFVDKPKWTNALRLINHFGYADSVAAAAVQDLDEVSGETHDRQHALPAKVHNQAVEDFATDRKKHKDFSWDTLAQITRLLKVGANSKARKGFQLDNDSRSMVFGTWTHGGMQGISTNTRAYPATTQYVNAFLKYHAPKHTYSSFVISVNAFAPPHLDPHNSPNSLNLTVSYGNFSGGELWISEEGTPQPQCDPVAVGQWRVKKNEQGVRGHLYDSYEKPVYFSPKLLHATQGWKGERFSLTAFTSRGHPKLNETDVSQLMLLNFPLPKQQQALPATPSKVSRFLVEFCCSPDSKLSQERSASRGCHCIRVTEELDATRPRTIKHVVDQITLAARDEGGVSKPNVLIFASLPCTGGCTWQRINSKTAEGGGRVESHKQLFRKLFRSLRKRFACLLAFV